MVPLIFPLFMSTPAETMPLMIACSPTINVPVVWISPSTRPSTRTVPSKLTTPLKSTSFASSVKFSKSVSVECSCCSFRAHMVCPPSASYVLTPEYLSCQFDPSRWRHGDRMQGRSFTDPVSHLQSAVEQDTVFDREHRRLHASVEDGGSP